MMGQDLEMNWMKTIIALVALVFSIAASAVERVEENKTILLLATTSSGVAYVAMSNPTVIPGRCGYYLLVKVELNTPEKRAMYGTLLAAKTANKPINLHFEDHNNTTDCTARQVTVLNS